MPRVSSNRPDEEGVGLRMVVSGRKEENNSELVSSVVLLRKEFPI